MEIDYYTEPRCFTCINLIKVENEPYHCKHKDIKDFDDLCSLYFPIPDFIHLGLNLPELSEETTECSQCRCYIKYVKSNADINKTISVTCINGHNNIIIC